MSDTYDELTGSEEQYRLLGATQTGTESEDHLPFPVPTMGSDSADKSEERRGDKVAYFGALVSASPCSYYHSTKNWCCIMAGFHTGKLLQHQCILDP